MTIKDSPRILSVLPEPAVLVSCKGEILTFNKSFKRKICSFDDDDLSGKNILQFTISEKEKVKRFLQNCSRSRQLTLGKMDFQPENSERKSFRCEGVLLEPATENESAKIFLRFKPKELTDVRFRLLSEKIDKLNVEILERKRAVERNRKLYEQAREASRLKDEFLATISHELRTPLNSILGWTNILKSGNVDEQLSEKALETIDRNTRVQVQLIEDILDVSRMITGKMRLKNETVQIAPVIMAAVDSVRPMAQNKGVFLRTIIDPNATMISGDAERIQQIIWNLLSNAIKFTPKDGHVDIELKQVDSTVSIIVSDTGEGISESFVPFVFERFLQADSSKTRQHGGLGLGLAIVRHLVELHGGNVSVKSEGVGKGSIFTVNFPVLEKEVAQFPKEPKEENSVLSEFTKAISKSNFDRLEDLRLLVVDDEPDARELLKIILEKRKARVVTASSAAEAYEKFSTRTFDVIISDIAMPGEDGFSLIQKIRSVEKTPYRDIPAIAMTAHARKEDRLQALSVGFDSYIAKPFDPDDLISVISNVTKLALEKYINIKGMDNVVAQSI